MFRLNNPTRDYQWGSPTAISHALGRAPSGGPEAELWIGAHPDAPSQVLTDDGAVGLDEYIAQAPLQRLGDGTRLPFLMKLLAADGALSLQVHPSKSQAEAGFAAEEAAGVARNDASRNYKDDNHKPEMIYALTPFEALCGFRERESSRIAFVSLAHSGDPLLSQVATDLSEAGGIQRAFERLLTADSELLSSAVDSAVTTLGALSQHSLAEQTVLDLAAEYPGDAGALISLMLNRVHLDPGEAVSMAAGNVHAYLSGLGVEVMASSDNVLRGGLTPKHVDVPELLKIVDFSPVAVPYVQAERGPLDTEIYDSGFPDFRLQRLELNGDTPEIALEQNGALLVLVLDGELYLDSPKGSLSLERGQSAFVSADEAPTNAHLSTNSDHALAFAVTAGRRANA